MSNLKLFLKENKQEKTTTTFAPTKSLCDEKGKPLEWVIKAITTKENEKLRDECSYETPVKGRPNVFRTKLDTNKYIVKMMVACVVEPNLFDKELQDSYGVMTPEELIKEMIDIPAEFDDFAVFIQKYNGFNVTLEDKVETAKN